LRCDGILVGAPCIEEPLLTRLLRPKAWELFVAEGIDKQVVVIAHPLCVARAPVGKCRCEIRLACSNRPKNLLVGRTCYQVVVAVFIGQAMGFCNDSIATPSMLVSLLIVFVWQLCEHRCVGSFTRLVIWFT